MSKARLFHHLLSLIPLYWLKSECTLLLGK